MATDGQTTFTVRVSTDDIDVVGTPIPVGPVNVVGIFSNFDPNNPAPCVAGTTYQLLLRSVADVDVVPESSSLLIVGVTVLGLGLFRER